MAQKVYVKVNADFFARRRTASEKFSMDGWTSVRDHASTALRQSRLHKGRRLRDAVYRRGGGAGAVPFPGGG